MLKIGSLFYLWKEVSEFHSRKHTIPASELQYPSVISEEVNPELRLQDTKFSECPSRQRLQGVKFGEQTPGHRKPPLLLWPL